MERSEFIKFVESNFEKVGINEYRELMNWAEYIYDELEILEDEDKVIFRYERFYCGGSEWETNEYSFEDFYRLYNAYELKYTW